MSTPVTCAIEGRVEALGENKKRELGVELLVQRSTTISPGPAKRLFFPLSVEALRKVGLGDYVRLTIRIEEVEVPEHVRRIEQQAAEFEPVEEWEGEP